VQQETFISYRGYRWLIITALAAILSAVVYAIDDPVGGRNGGTVIGYTYGTLATIGIMWLMSYGARKRAYNSALGTVQGWLSAHVWIGIGLLLLVPLHAGFSFGWNVHTLAYAFMVVTIVSGIWGVVNYSTLASRIESHRGGVSSKRILEQLDSLSSDISSMCQGKSDAFVSSAQRLDPPFSVGLLSLLRKREFLHVDQKVAGEALTRIPEGEREEALRLFGVIDQKCDLMTVLFEEARIKALLRLWLFIHVPVSIALCVALAIHILSVFFFW
jgi:hypothetical protein